MSLLGGNGGGGGEDCLEATAGGLDAGDGSETKLLPDNVRGGFGGSCGGVGFFKEKTELRN